MNTGTLGAAERRQHERRRQGATAGQAHAQDHGHQGHKASYGRFAAMVATSTVAGFAAMYLNVWELGHVAFSWMRLFMALIMGGVMTAVMMLFMWRMYPNTRANWGVMAVAAALFLAGLALARSQATVGDVAWMRAMIPHHSIAILTSERARITDPRARELADGIIETQREEIAQMQKLIAELEGR